MRRGFRFILSAGFRVGASGFPGAQLVQWLEPVIGKIQNRNGGSGLEMEVAKRRIFFRIAAPCCHQWQPVNRSYAAIRIMLELVEHRNGLGLTQHIAESLLASVVQLLPFFQTCRRQDRSRHPGVPASPVAAPARAAQLPL